MNVHPLDRCVWCGARHKWRGVELKRIVFKFTSSPAVACVDVHACVRRQARAKRIRLYGKYAA